MLSLFNTNSGGVVVFGIFLRGGGGGGGGGGGAAAAVVGLGRGKGRGAAGGKRSAGGGGKRAAGGGRGEESVDVSVGRVEGVKLDRDDRDSFRMSVDDVVNRIDPRPNPRLFQVFFSPVVKTLKGKLNGFETESKSSFHPLSRCWKVKRIDFRLNSRHYQVFLPTVKMLQGKLN